MKKYAQPIIVIGVMAIPVCASYKTRRDGLVFVTKMKDYIHFRADDYVVIGHTKSLVKYRIVGKKAKS